jgi:hypothetical protein
MTFRKAQLAAAAAATVLAGVAVSGAAFAQDAAADAGP